MPLQDSHQIVSVDDHLIEHPRVWEDRLPQKYRERGPRIIEAEGRQLWCYDGDVQPTVGLNAVVGKDRKDWGLDPIRFDDMLVGCYDPQARLKDMDVDGVHASVCFPSFPGFAGSIFFRGSDKELALACLKAWNDFSVDEWCATAPDRYIPVAMVPFWDIDAAVAEAKRVAEKGARTISFPDSPVPMGLPSFHSRHWDPLWAVCEEAQLPVSLHFGSSTFVPGFSFQKTEMTQKSLESNLGEAPFLVPIVLFGSNSMWTAVDLLFSGALQRFPNLKFSLSEGGIGWMPYLIERADYEWERHRWYQNVDKDTRPSELFHRHFWGCIVDDVHGLKNRNEIGVDRIMVEVDYPHSDSNWPNSRKMMAEAMTDIPDDEVAMIVETNARKLFRFPR